MTYEELVRSTPFLVRSARFMALVAAMVDLNARGYNVPQRDFWELWAEAKQVHFGQVPNFSTEKFWELYGGDLVQYCGWTQARVTAASGV